MINVKKKFVNLYASMEKCRGERGVQTPWTPHRYVPGCLCCKLYI